jgi:hypothetical protein
MCKAAPGQNLGVRATVRTWYGTVATVLSVDYLQDSVVQLKRAYGRRTYSFI